jgi:sulfatase modifying factor 1
MGSPTEVPDTVAIAAGRLRDTDVSAFRIGRTPVTNRQYAPFLTTSRTPAPGWWDDPAFRAPDQPVVGVSWDEAEAYCRWLSEIAGGVWRLPTEAEWELAMSGGLSAPATAWGDMVPAGEIPEGPIAGPWEVGRGTPNAFGVLDPGTMVHEWCLDRREPSQSHEPGGSAGSLPGGLTRRASRGGSWGHRVRWSAPSARSSLPPVFRYSDYGFRVLREGPV